jgi:flagellar FliL protein
MAKAPAKPAAEAAAPAGGKSKKKLIVIGVAAIVLLGAVGGGAAMFLSKKGGAASQKEHKAAEPAKIPVFVPLEPFTVNLQAENGDKYLQVTMTLQVPDEEQMNLIKANMPQVRSRLLMLLSSKDSTEILTGEGKEKLIQQIEKEVDEPFTPKGEPQKVTGVFFTSFVVQ